MQISSNEAATLFILITLVFLLAPIALLSFIRQYNTRKKQYINEKIQMKKDFDEEMYKTRMEVKEHTLQTIGADLHDNIGQLLSLTNLTLSSIQFTNIPKAEQKIRDSLQLTKRSIKELRQLAQLMNGHTFSPNNLVKAIEAELAWIEKAETHKIICRLMPELLECNADKDIVLFRLFQETVNNILKHAEASVITVELSCVDHSLQMNISDNGRGFDLAESKEHHGFGLKNMYKRSALIGGEARIAAKKNKGTSVTITVPYP